MMQRKWIIFLFFTAFVTQSLFARENQFYFSSLDLKDGLSQLSVLKIFQDSKGFMWFGTRNGLNKYDGTAFTVYKHSNTDPFSLSHNHILSLSEDGEGKIWIGTMNGLNRLDPLTNRIISYNNQELYPDHLISGCWINHILKDSLNNLWIGTDQGLFLYNPENDDFELIKPEGLPDTYYVTTFQKGINGEYILGTLNKGLFIYDDQFRLLHHFSKEDPQAPLTDNHIYVTYQDKEGYIWVGTRWSGLNKINLQNRSVTFFLQSDGTIGNNSIRTIVPYGEKLVIGTFDGLSIIDPVTHEWEKYTNFDPSKGGLNNFSVFSTYVDTANTLWIGTYSGGINFTNPFNNRFVFSEPKNYLPGFRGILGPMVYQSAKEVLWIATEGSGLVAFNRNTNTYRQYRPESFSGNFNERIFIKSLFLEGDVIWCGTQRGTIYKFDTNTHTFTLAYTFQQDATIYSMVRGNDHSLWIGTTSNNGLNRIYPDGQIVDRFLLADSSLYNFVSVRCFLEISKDIFLAGTHSHGLIRYDHIAGTVEMFNTQKSGSNHLFSDYVTDLKKDAAGNIWVGTFGGGVCLYNDDRGIRAIYTIENGLPDDNIYSIQIDNDRKIWVSTGNGLSCFNPIDKQFVNYTGRDEIAVNEFSFNGGICLPDNTVHFSGSNGFLSFNPSQLKANPFIPPVVVTSFKVNNKEVKSGGESYTLKYNENNFSISYAALNYLFPHQNQYMYKLEGYDRDWNDVQQRNEAFYTNLKPGKYTFRVKASNNDGIWNEEGTSLSLYILNPWWKRWYAILAYVCIAAILFYIVFYYFHIKRKLEKDLQEKKKEQERQEELHAARIRMFTNFSHELRTPLMLILSPLEEIFQKVDVNRNIKESLQLVYGNAQRLLLLVNQLMDLRKNHSGRMQLKLSTGSLYSFLKEIYIAFNQIAIKNGVQFKLETDLPEQISCFDKSLLEKVSFNLLSNAFKYTPAGEHITLRLQHLSPVAVKEFFPDQAEALLPSSLYACLSVEDTGRGIPDQDKAHIFSPFYQVEEDDIKNSGTGIGLSFVFSMLRLHKGIVWLEDNKPRGAVFRIIIPVDKAVFDKEQFLAENVENRYPLPEIKESVTPFSLSFARRYSVVLAEDNDEVRTYLKQSLDPYMDVQVAADGMEAWDLISSALPDLVISDVMMPGMDGLELCTKIKEDITTGHIPVIIITAKSMLVHIKDGFRCGADDYIVKPFHLDILLHRIHNIVTSRERLKELYGKKFSLESFGIETTSADDRFMQKFFEVIEQYISDPELSVDILCREIGIGRANLYRKLKAITDLSPIELIRNKRLEVATRILIETDMNIAEISTQVGFNSQAYFATCFKALYGISPKEYAQQYRTSGQ